MVLTLEAAADRLHTTPEKIQAELEAGRLDGFKLGDDEWRTTEEALLRFMGIKVPSEQRETEPMSVAGQVAGKAGLDYRSILAGAEWHPVEPFPFKWPNGTEQFEEGVEAKVKIGRKEHRIRIGFCDREAAGDKHRRRAVVFLGRPPSLIALVEFAGEDSNIFPTTGRMVSVIKLKGGQQHVRPGDPVPPEYAGLPLVTYNQVVTGPYAAGSLAVVAGKDDYNLMAHHALIRAHSKGII